MLHLYVCPHCFRGVSVALDAAKGTRFRIDDCECCDRPVEIQYTVEDGKVVEFIAKAGK